MGAGETQLVLEVHVMRGGAGGRETSDTMYGAPATLGMFLPIRHQSQSEV